jgi:myo-inositol-1(or 4)-monophosphatase
VLTGVDRHGDNGLPPYAVLVAVSSAVQRPRIKGAAALDICHVACGRADGYVETSIFAWDVAAAGLIAQQAGGRSEMTRYHGAMRLQFMVTNSHLHEPLRHVVDNAGA